MAKKVSATNKQVESKATTNPNETPTIKPLTKKQCTHIDKVLGHVEPHHIGRKITNLYPELKTWQVTHKIRLMKYKKLYDEQLLKHIEETIAAELKAAKS